MHEMVIKYQKTTFTIFETYIKRYLRLFMINGNKKRV